MHLNRRRGKTANQNRQEIRGSYEMMEIFRGLCEDKSANESSDGQ
jgi:hypothetical protein